LKVSVKLADHVTGTNTAPAPKEAPTRDLENIPGATSQNQLPGFCDSLWEAHLSWRAPRGSAKTAVCSRTRPRRYLRLKQVHLTEAEASAVTTARFERSFSSRQGDSFLGSIRPGAGERQCAARTGGWQAKVRPCPVVRRCMTVMLHRRTGDGLVEVEVAFFRESLMSRVSCLPSTLSPLLSLPEAATTPRWDRDLPQHLGPLGSSSSQHRRTPELVLQRSHASFRITFRPPGAEDRTHPGDPATFLEPSHQLLRTVYLPTERSVRNGFMVYGLEFRV